MVSVEATENVLERLLADDDTKDVEIQMKDGTLWAHAVVLGANSDAIAGMLRYGIAASRKQLSWAEHTIEAGRFLLRLLYTGTVADEDLRRPEGSTEQEVPLPTLFSALSIAKVYQVTHVSHAIIEALKRRMSVETFDEICSLAIKLDITALRLHCLRYAENPDRESRVAARAHALRKDSIPDATLTQAREIQSGARVRALRVITVDCALVHEGVMGTVNSQNRIIWDNRFITRADQVRDMVEVVSTPTNCVLDKYKAHELSPEVMCELAELLGPVEPAEKRRRVL